MRTNIDIDDELLQKVIRISGAKTKKAAVEAALQLLVDVKAREKALKNLWGKVAWQGDLNKSREGRVQPIAPKKAK